MNRMYLQIDGGAGVAWDEPEPLDGRVEAARELIARLCGDGEDVREVLAGLGGVQADLRALRDLDVRLAAIDDALGAIAELELDCRVPVRHDGTPIDMIAMRVNALSLQIASRIGEIEAASVALRKSEDRLRQAQKMESVGRLAGGIAHDFNNLLSIILSYTALALEDLPPDAPLRADLGEIQQAAERAATLTSRLLAFGRQQIMAPTSLDVGGWLAGARLLVERMVPAEVIVQISHEENLCVNADRAQIQQVLVALVANARDAMPAGGVLTIAARGEGEQVVLTVTDTGVGMDAAVQSRLFEPFFTTKGVGHGAGLGLSTAFGIVRQHRGNLTAKSQVGCGSTFEVRLPRLAAAPVARPIAARSQGGETVLLCDDDDAVRRVASNVLRGRGYTVLEARNGADALSRYGARDDVGLLVTDLVMPTMTGRELAEQMVALNPHLPVLYMSGYTDDEVARDDVAGGQAFLQKPFTPDALAQKVREILDTVR